MRIFLESDEGERIKLVFPKFLMLNYLFAFLLHIQLKKKDLDIKTRHIYKLMKVLRKYRNIDLVEIFSLDGDNVLISL